MTYRSWINAPGWDKQPWRPFGVGRRLGYQGSMAYSAIWNSTLRASVTRLDASKISSETRLPWAS